MSMMGPTGSMPSNQPGGIANKPLFPSAAAIVSVVTVYVFVRIIVDIIKNFSLIFNNGKIKIKKN